MTTALQFQLFHKEHVGAFPSKRNQNLLLRLQGDLGAKLYNRIHRDGRLSSFPAAEGSVRSGRGDGRPGTSGITLPGPRWRFSKRVNLHRSLPRTANIILRFKNLCGGNNLECVTRVKAKSYLPGSFIRKEEKLHLVTKVMIVNEN